ncbi:MAG: hypothetical protein QGG56_04035, partial [Dehalococcoidia bacterium]|nr:hypothetical protein [Dehalococcoidia bacterium]
MSTHRLIVSAILALLLFVAACRPSSTPTPTTTPTGQATPAQTPTAAPPPPLGHTPTPTPVPSPTHTPEPPGTYRNLNYGFSVVFPPSWDTQETGETAPIVISRVGSGYPAVFVSLNNLPEVTPVDQVAAEMVAAFQEALTDLTVIQEAEIEQG